MVLLTFFKEDDAGNDANDDDDNEGEGFSVPQPQLRSPYTKHTPATDMNQLYNQHIASLKAMGQKSRMLVSEIAAKSRQKFKKEAEKYSQEARERAIESARIQEIANEQQLRMMAVMLGVPMPAHFE